MQRSREILILKWHIGDFHCLLAIVQKIQCLWGNGFIIIHITRIPRSHINNSFSSNGSFFNQNIIQSTSWSGKIYCTITPTEIHILTSIIGQNDSLTNPFLTFGLSGRNMGEFLPCSIGFYFEVKRIFVNRHRLFYRFRQSRRNGISPVEANLHIFISRQHEHRCLKNALLVGAPSRNISCIFTIVCIIIRSIPCYISLFLALPT